MSGCYACCSCDCHRGIEVFSIIVAEELDDSIQQKGLSCECVRYAIRHDNVSCRVYSREKVAAADRLQHGGRRLHIKLLWHHTCSCVSCEENIFAFFYKMFHFLLRQKVVTKWEHHKHLGVSKSANRHRMRTCCGLNVGLSASSLAAEAGCTGASVAVGSLTVSLTWLMPSERSTVFKVSLTRLVDDSCRCRFAGRLWLFAKLDDESAPLLTHSASSLSPLSTITSMKAYVRQART